MGALKVSLIDERSRRICDLRIQHPDRNGHCLGNCYYDGRSTAAPHYRNMPRPHYILDGEYTSAASTHRNTKTRIHSRIKSRHDIFGRDARVCAATVCVGISATVLGGVAEFTRDHARIVCRQLLHILLLEIKRASMVFWRPMRAAKYLSTLALGASEGRLLLARVEFACFGHFILFQSHAIL